MRKSALMAAAAVAALDPAAFGSKDDPPKEADLKELAVALKKATDDVKTWAEKAEKESKALDGRITEETKKAADLAMIKHNELSARLTELEQKLARDPGKPERAKTVGQQFVANPDLAGWIKSGGKGRFSMAVKA